MCRVQTRRDGMAYGSNKGGGARAGSVNLMSVGWSRAGRSPGRPCRRARESNNDLRSAAARSAGGVFGTRCPVRASRAAGGAGVGAGRHRAALTCDGDPGGGGDAPRGPTWACTRGSPARAPWGLQGRVSACRRLWRLDSELSRRRSLLFVCTSGNLV